MATLDLRPRRLKPGLINMKYQAIAFGPLFAARDARFMDRLAELTNLSNGERTVAEITRVVGYEIGPVAPELVAEMFSTLAEHGYVVLEGNEAPNGPGDR
jgi:hypothetical protein